MIVIDGRESAMTLSHYANLEEVLCRMIDEEALEQRIVTDVLVNGEMFSELYPHQAEDIGLDGVHSLEVRTVSMAEMASDVVLELPKVVDIMAGGSRRVAELLRQADIAEALEILQDTIAVSRDFLDIVQLLRSQYASGVSKELVSLNDTLGDLLGEIVEVMGNEDWILVADLLEYEYLPACEGWRGIISSLSHDINAAGAA